MTVKFEITLAYLNELRAMNGKAPLKSWKESKDKLAKAIDKENETRVAGQNERLEEEARIARVSASAKNKPINILVKKTIEKNKAKIAKASQVSAKQEEAAKVNVAQIAKELGINPKVARAKLRKANIDRADSAAIRKALTK